MLSRMKMVALLSNVTEQLDAYEGRTTLEIVVIAIFLAVLILLSILGNAAVIFAICIDYKLKQEVSNLFIINLAVTDLTSGLIVINFSFLSVVWDEWSFGGALCDIVCCMNYCLIIVSMLTLCSISIDRYQAILYPLLYVSKATKGKVLMAIVYMWFQGIMFSMIPVVMHWISYDYWETICAIQWYKERSKAVYYVVTAFIMCFLLPGLALVYNYTKILKEVKKTLKIVQPSVSLHENGAKNKRKTSNANKKTVRSLLIVVVAYFVCMTPFSVTKLIKVVVFDQDFLPNWINTTASLIGYCSSSINPLIYGIFRPDFRNAFKHMYHKVIPRCGTSRSNNTSEVHSIP